MSTAARVPSKMTNRQILAVNGRVNAVHVH